MLHKSSDIGDETEPMPIISICVVADKFKCPPGFSAVCSFASYLIFATVYIRDVFRLECTKFIKMFESGVSGIWRRKMKLFV